MTIIESNSNLIGIHRKLKHKWATLTDLEFANNLMTRSYHAGNRIKYWGRIGAFGGGIFGLFFGSMFIFIPRDEPLLVTGLLAAWSFLGLAGAMVVGGLSAVGAGIYNLGISHDSILQSETAFNSGKRADTANNFATEAILDRNIINRNGAKLSGAGPTSRGSTKVERWEHSLLP
jgi:hypothetical protein